MARDKNKKLKLWQENPVAFFEQLLGVTTLEDYQKSLLMDVANNDKIAVRATHSVGKTWSFARIALWFFTCFRNSIIITTAPTSRQVDALLWGEIRDAYKNSKLPIGGRLLNLSLKQSDKWYAIGFTTDKKAGESNEQTGSAFQGFHSDHVMIIFDEATGIEPDIWVMAEGLQTSGKTVKFLAIANPTTRNCEFFKCFQDISYKKIKISCFDSPNLIANGFVDMESIEQEINYIKTLDDGEKLSRIAAYAKPVPHLLTAQWVIPNLLKWGMKHPLSLSKIFGEFPSEDDTVLIQFDYLHAAVERDFDIDPLATRYIGVDVARYGSDSTVFTEMIGNRQVSVQTITKRDLSHISGLLINMLKERPGETIITIDATGIGAGVVDNLISAQDEGLVHKDVEIVELHFGQSPADKALENKKTKSSADKLLIKQDKERYVNLKAKMFDILADDLRDNIQMLNESIYFETLPTIKMKYDNKGRMLVESKDDYKKRTGMESPDHADSFVLCNYARHITLKAGTFKDVPKSEPMVRQVNRKPRPKRFKVTAY